MKQWLLGACVVAVLAGPFAEMAEAKRLGGGGSAGMQRSMPTRPAQGTPPNAAPQNATGTPAQQAQPAAAAGAGAAATAAAPKRNWLGPVAGIAAGLGIAALMSHLGMGEALGNFLTMALLAVVAVVAIGWLMRRFGNKAGARTGGPALATATAGASSAGPSAQPAWASAQPMARQATPGSAAASFGEGFSGNSTALQPLGTASAAAPSLPADFDTAGFERIAKMIFIRLQAANDSADLNDLRQFTTPELFAHLRLDLQERGSQPQQTDVVEVRPEVLDFSRESERDVVSVRYHGLIREQAGTDAQAFDEVWHLVQPRDGSRSWAIAGIQQSH
jgi:predicted lipid-binding transport protein (Tim44 family)